MTPHGPGGQPGPARPPSSGYQRWTPGSNAGPGPHPPPQGQAHASAPPPGAPPSHPPPYHPATGGHPPPNPHHAPGMAPAAARLHRATPPGSSGNGSGAAHLGAPPSAAAPSYDVVHLSARNARLEEKLSKALAKNRSMAKYYDQLLAKTRDAHEREAEALRDDVARLSADAGSSRDVRAELERAGAEREALRAELEALRAKVAAEDGKGREDAGAVASALRSAKDALALKESENARLRARLVELDASLGAAESAFAGGEPLADISNAGSDGFSTGTTARLPGGSRTLREMQRMLDEARDERERERKMASRRDAEMTKQLEAIKEQALDRINESSAAAREVAALKERAKAAEAERDRLRDLCAELEGDEHERRDAKRRAADAEAREKSSRERAERCDVAEAKLRASEANAASLQNERAAAHAKLQEMTERLLQVTAEKDVLVRHSAHQVHVEAELANARRELERVSKGSLAARAKERETSLAWNQGAEGLGRVMRAHIYGHARWEREMAEAAAGAADAHEHGQRSVVRLVAAAEAEAASLAGEAIEVTRTTRQLLREYGAECAAVVQEVTRRNEARANERVEAALSMMEEAERRAERAEEDAARSEAEARRARSAALRAGALPSSLRDEEGDPEDPEDPDALGDDSEDVRRTFADSDRSTLRKRLRAAQFQLLGLAAWRAASKAEPNRGEALLRQQVTLARREAATAERRLEAERRGFGFRGAALRWGNFAAALLRRADRAAIASADANAHALAREAMSLQIAKGEAHGAAEALAASEHQLERAHRVLDALRLEHDDALRALAEEKRLREELSEMIRAEGAARGGSGSGGTTIADGPTVSEAQKAMEQLADEARAHVETAERASVAAEARGRAEAEAARLRSRGDKEEEKDEEEEKKDPHRASLERDLDACHDALLLLADEEDALDRAKRAERNVSGLALADPAEGKDGKENASLVAARRVRKAALEVKAELIAALLDAADRRQAVAAAEGFAGALEARVRELDQNASSLRGGAAASKMLRFAADARRERETRAAAREAEDLRAEAAAAKDAAARTGRAKTRWAVGATRAAERRDAAMDATRVALERAAEGARAERARGAREAEAAEEAKAKAKAEAAEEAEAIRRRRERSSERGGKSFSLEAGLGAPEKPVAARSPERGGSRRATASDEERAAFAHRPRIARSRDGALEMRGGGIERDDDDGSSPDSNGSARRTKTFSAMMRERRKGPGPRGETRALRTTEKKKGWSPPPWDSSPLRKSQRPKRERFGLHADLANPYAGGTAPVRKQRGR